MSQIVSDQIFCMDERGQRRERMADIYENADPVKRHKTSTVTENNDSPGGDLARKRCHGLIAVSLVLLCVILLVGVVVLWVMFNTQTTAINQLRNENNDLMISREQLQTSYTNLTVKGDQLQMSYDNLTARYNQLQNKYNNLTVEQRWLNSSYNNLTEERNQIQKKRDELNTWLSALENGWSYFNSSFYYNSTGKKNWSESQRDCKARGADLVIINNNEEKDFIARLKRGAWVWIGLTDIAVEGTWEWVDGSALTYMYWDFGQPGLPGPFMDEDCVQFREKWHDNLCNELSAWICEKII